MRPWEREQGTPPPESPPRQPKGSLSSMVVRPPENDGGREGEGGGGVDAEKTAEVQHTERRYREVSPLPSHRTRSQRLPDGSGYGVSAASDSPPSQPRPEHFPYNPDFDQPGEPQYPREYRGGKGGDRHRYRSPSYGRGSGGGSLRDISPPYGPGRGRGRFPDHSPTYGRGRGGGRFREPTYGRGRGGGRFRDLSPTYGDDRSRGRFRDPSPTYGRERAGGRYHDPPPTYERERGTGRFHDLPPAYERERSGRYRELSPLCGHGTDARFFDRGVHETGPELLPFRDEGTRNNPNIEPRVGDWICKNPLCGNLNFARRDYCNNCNKFRYGPGDVRSSGSPCRGFSLDRAPPHILVPPAGRSVRRETNGYRSPPHGWARDGPRDPPLPRHGGRFPGSPMQRGRAEYCDEIDYSTRGKFDRPVPQDWDIRGRGRGRGRGRDNFVHERRGYDRDNWIQDSRERTRSRSPRRVQPPKDYRRDSYSGRGRGDHGRGRGDRLVMGRGRNSDML